MKKFVSSLSENQEGFIPMMICIFAVIGAVIYLGYRVVINGQS